MKMAHRGEEGGADGGGRIWGVGRPLLGYRNWDGYSAARDGPDTRFRERRGVTAERALAEELQRRRPELMVDADTVEGVLREDRADRRARRLEGMRLQGNALWVPPLPPHPHHHDGSTRGRGRKRLLVHCAGPVLDRLHLSWVHEQQQASSCWMSGGRWCSGEVGSIRQLAPMNQYDRNDHACVLAEPPTCFARGDTEAALFQLLEAAEEEEAEEEVMEEEEGEGRVPYYVSPLQKLLFPHRLLDVATRPAKSVHRAAFLSDDLGVHEWSSARGAARVGVTLPTPVVDAWDSASAAARLAWGSHPRCLWLSSGGSLCRLDLRQRAAALFSIEPPGWPRDLLANNGADSGGGGGQASSSSRAGAAVLAATAGAGGAGSVVGPVERHPLDENLLFVAVDHSLLALDLRQPRQPLSILPQAEATHLLALGVFHTPSSLPQPQTWIAACCRALPRLHLHLETTDPLSSPEQDALGLVGRWNAALHHHHQQQLLQQQQQQQRRRPLEYETATFVNWDHTPTRASPVWLAGLGALCPLPWDRHTEAAEDDEEGEKEVPSPSYLLLPYATSLGDVYLQRVVTALPSADSKGLPPALAGLRPIPRAALPCGLSPHATAPDDHDASASLPSSAFFQAWDADSLRTHSTVAVDPPPRLFGGLLPTTNPLGGAEGPLSWPKAKEEGGGRAGDRQADARVAAVAEAVGKMREELRGFAGQHPRTLGEVAAEVERLSPGVIVMDGREGGGEWLRVLQEVLLQEENEGEGEELHGRLLVRAQAAGAAPAAVSSVVRPEEAVPLPMGGSGSVGTGAPPACLRPSEALYWAADSEEALAFPTAAAAAAAAAARASTQGGSGSGGQGLDEDMTHFLRGRWYAEEEGQGRPR